MSQALTGVVSRTPFRLSLLQRSHFASSKSFRYEPIQQRFANEAIRACNRSIENKIDCPGFPSGMHDARNEWTADISVTVLQTYNTNLCAYFAMTYRMLCDIQESFNGPEEIVNIFGYFLVLKKFNTLSDNLLMSDATIIRQRDISCGSP